MGIMNGLEGFPASLASFSLRFLSFSLKSLELFPMEEGVGLGGKLDSLCLMPGSFSGSIGTFLCAPWPRAPKAKFFT